MASEQQVRQYLAYWFQLGKKVLIRNGEVALLPRPVIQGDRYSPEFEDCWRQIQAIDAKDCYLEGMSQTIAELLTPAWEINPCARCSMPIPVLKVGVSSLECPCLDVPGWPDMQTPIPRSPVNNQDKLQEIRNRLLRASQLHTQSPSRNSESPTL